MSNRSYILTAALLLSASFTAQATPMFIQTDAATGGIFADTSRIQAAGANDTPNLILNGPAVLSTLYTVLVQPFSGTKTSSSTTLNDHVAVVQENSITVFSGLFSFSQPLTETVVGGVATFAALAGPTVQISLTNGHFLLITPQANANLGANQVVQANFQLSSTSQIVAAPEPSSIVLITAGLAGLVIIARRRKIA